MKYIYIKFQDEPIEVSDKDGKMVEDIFFNKSLTSQTPVQIGNWSGLKGEIKQIKTGREKKYQEYNQDIEKEYLEYRRNFLSLSLEDKAKRIGIFSLMWYCLTGVKEIPIDIQNKAIELQKTFFEKNLRRIYPDPVIFKELMENSGLQKKGGLNQFNEAGIRIIEKQIGEDMRMAEAMLDILPVKEARMETLLEEEITPADFNL